MLQCFVISSVITLSLVTSACAEQPEENTKCGAVSHRDWMGVEPTHVEYLIRPLGLVIVQHTSTPPCSTTEECSQRVLNIQSYHMNVLGWDDIGPSFLVGDDGRVYEGSGWLHVGAHTYRYNRKSVGVSFIGFFNNKLPSAAAINATQALLACGVRKKHLKSDYKVVAAKQLHATLSPGQTLYEEVQKWPRWTSRTDNL